MPVLSITYIFNSTEQALEEAAKELKRQNKPVSKEFKEVLASFELLLIEIKNLPNSTSSNYEKCLKNLKETITENIKFFTPNPIVNFFVSTPSDSPSNKYLECLQNLKEKLNDPSCDMKKLSKVAGATYERVTMKKVSAIEADNLCYIFMFTHLGYFSASGEDILKHFKDTLEQRESGGYEDRVYGTLEAAKVATSRGATTAVNCILAVQVDKEALKKRDDHFMVFNNAFNFENIATIYWDEGRSLINNPDFIPAIAPVLIPDSNNKSDPKGEPGVDEGNGFFSMTSP